jgi:hypothetical protein
MPLDVELMEIDMGGVLEPKPEWTAAARRFITEELRAQKSRQGFQLEEFPEEFRDRPRNRSSSTSWSSSTPPSAARSARTASPCSSCTASARSRNGALGEVRVLRERSGADYALFVHVRDSYASDGRKLVMIAGAA